MVTKTKKEKRLSIEEQRKLIKNMPEHYKEFCKKYCEECKAKGMTLSGTMKSIKDTLSSIVSKVGPTVLKEFIIPFMKHKAGIPLGPIKAEKKAPKKKK